MNFGQWGDDMTVDGIFQYYGHDIYHDYRDYYHLDGYDGKYGHYMLTGELNSLIMNNFVVSWLVNPSYNLNIFAEITHRNQEIETGINYNNLIVSFGIRTTLDRKYYDF